MTHQYPELKTGMSPELINTGGCTSNSCISKWENSRESSNAFSKRNGQVYAQTDLCLQISKYIS